MADANLLSALKRRNGRGRTLSDVVVFGRVRCAIKPPKILGKGLEFGEGFFAILDAYAFKCQGEDYFCENGVGDVNKVYFTKGSMIVFLNDKNLIGKDIKVYDKSTRRGVNIKQQFNAKSDYDGITALAFVRNNSTNSFVVVPNKVTELGTNDPDARGTALEDFMVQVVLNKEGVVPYPITLDSLVEYCGSEEYDEMPLDSLEGSIQKSTKTYLAPDSTVDVTKIDLHLVNHLKAKEVSEFYDAFKEEIKDMSLKRRKYSGYLSSLLNDLCNEEQDEDFNPEEVGYKKNSKERFMTIEEVAADIRNNFIEGVAAHQHENIGNSKLKGRVYVEEFLNFVSPSIWKDRTDVNLSADAINECITGLKNYIQVDYTCLYGGNGQDFCSLPILKDNIKFAIVVVGITTGLGAENLINNYNVARRYNGLSINSWFYALIRCPYLLGIMGNHLGVVGCDVLYLSYYKKYSRGILLYENGSYRGDLRLLESLEDASPKDSFVLKSALKGMRDTYPGRAKQFLSLNKFPARKDIVELLRVMCGNILLSEAMISQITVDNWYNEKRINSLIDSGVVDVIDSDTGSFLVLASDLEKEVIIYETFVNKGREETGIQDSVIEEKTKEFEKSRGFRLEPLQKQAIYLCKNKAAVLSGCAGSGKTTTSDCMTEVLKTLEDYEIVYGTPTGKACRRLAEVVGGTVKTIHSLFGISVGDEPYLVPLYRGGLDTDKPRIYIFDEMAMCSMPLLYQIAKNLNPKDICYFLGDIKQLPPIGKGNPFKLLMTLLPCIELGVSKRAAEGSLVNYNTTILNNMSDDVIAPLKYDDSSFICDECNDADIPLRVCKWFRKFLNGEVAGKTWKEDDIQVITGYQKDDITFSAPNLNPPLHRLLRQQDKCLFIHNDREFCKNERVIHLNRNAYEMCRYIEEEDTFRQVVTFGIANGEMGKLDGIVRSDMVKIQPFSGAPVGCENIGKEEFETLLKRYDEKSDNLRDDTVISDSKYYFVKVRVYDVELKRDVYVLYRASVKLIDDTGLVLESSDLCNLDYAYALTTHKMQGSQSPIVILTFGSQCNPKFINRNMINTMITRSQGIVVMLGDIVGENSPINQGRQYVSEVTCNDALTLLVEG